MLTLSITEEATVPHLPQKVDDGMMDVITVKNVSRRVFVSNVSAYQKGTIIGTPAGDKILKHFSLSACRADKGNPFTVCYDGEMLPTTRAEIECMPKSIRFVIPNTVDVTALSCFSVERENAVK